MRGAHRHHYVDPRPEPLGELDRGDEGDLGAHVSAIGDVGLAILGTIEPNSGRLDIMDGEGLEEAEHEIGMRIGLDDEAMTEETSGHDTIPVTRESRQARQKSRPNRSAGRRIRRVTRRRTLSFVVITMRSS